MRIEKSDAIQLRKEGLSYSIISQELGVSKSTLSNWLKDIPFTPNAAILERIKHGQGTYGLKRRQMRLDEIEEFKKNGELEVGDISRRDLWMLGLGLWIGEGSKTIEQIRLVNSDPRVILLFMRWLREICKLENDNISVAMHLYPDSNERFSMKYWSELTRLPIDRFRKTQIDRRLDKKSDKVGKSIHGTLHVTVASNGNSERGVRLYRRLMGWISAVNK